jgi:chlorite dismutase
MEVDAFCEAAARAEQRLMQHSYSTIGLRADGDLLLWRMSETIEGLEETAADLLAAGIGSWMTPSISMIGLVIPPH